VVVTKLELSVSKRFVPRTSGYAEEVLFAVLDLDKAEEYPSNFVCLLPKKLENGCKTNSNFLDIFGNESSQIAIKLLTNALRSENDVKRALTRQGQKL
jgi:hypothetical protein